jgi:hypothetical protein
MMKKFIYSNIILLLLLFAAGCKDAYLQQVEAGEVDFDNQVTKKIADATKIVVGDPEPVLGMYSPTTVAVSRGASTETVTVSWKGGTVNGEEHQLLCLQI